jgi:hypothetical protein
MSRRAVAAGLVLCLLAGTTAGCGAIFNGSSQTVSARSAPEGAQITVEPGGMKYTTPTEMSLERKNSYVLTFRKAGYSDASVTVRKKASAGIIILDVLFTGLIGVIVDAATGSWNSLSPEDVTATLTKVDAAVEGPEQILVQVRGTRKGIVIDAPADLSVGVAER